MVNTAPEVFFCSCCGQDIWFIAQRNTQPEELLCDECKVRPRSRKSIIDPEHNPEQRPDYADNP